MHSVQERRCHPRVQLQAPGVVDLGDHKVLCRVVDLSLSGIAISTPADPPLRAVRVRFQLGGRDAAWTDLEARVVRSTVQDETRQTKLWGMRLQPMDLGTRTRVRGFVANKLRD